MKDFQIGNSTKLLFRNDPLDDLAKLTSGKRVMFVYGGGSVRTNGCYDDVIASVKKGNGHFFEFANASRELSDIQKGIQLTKENQIELLIGAGGASVMDATKIISFGHYNDNYWDLIKNDKYLEGYRHIPLILIPTYPSSGSEYDDSAVGTDKGYFGLAWGLTSEHSILVPKYSLSLNREMTTYSSLVTLVQLCIAILGDKNPISYDFGISVIKNVLKAAKKLKTDPNDLNSRGVILFGASISTSSWVGLGKEKNYAFEIYYIEIVAEVLFNTNYLKDLTIVFPQVLKFFAKSHEDDIRSLLHDAFGFDGSIDDSLSKIVQLFEEFNIDMKFNESFSDEKLSKIENKSSLTVEELSAILKNSVK